MSVLEKDNTAPLFISWTTEHYCMIKITKILLLKFNIFYTINIISTGKVTEQILRAYEKEQKLHQSILLKIADCMESDMLLFYLSCWTYQPYLDHIIEKQLHCMIKETRHV